MTRGSKITLAIVVVLIAVILAFRLRYPGKASLILPAASCNAVLWPHVYQRERLHVITECTAVEGHVLGLRRESDGDLHISLKPDRASVLNPFNVIHGHRTLVVEIICDHTPADDSAKSACEDFHPQIHIPRKGDHVRVIGSYVTDGDYGWNEIHPVSEIQLLP